MRIDSMALLVVFSVMIQTQFVSSQIWKNNNAVTESKDRQLGTYGATTQTYKAMTSSHSFQRDDLGNFPLKSTSNGSDGLNLALTNVPNSKYDEESESARKHSWHAVSRIQKRSSSGNKYIETKLIKEDILQLYERMKSFKIDVIRAPEKLSSEYPALKSEYSKINTRLQDITIKSLGRQICDAWEDVTTLFDMMEMNIVMRKHGCEAQLSIVAVPNDEGHPRRQITKLKAFVEKFGLFKSLFPDCFDGNGLPRVQHPKCEDKIDYMKLKFETLQSESLDFMSHSSPITRIIEEQFADIEQSIVKSFNPAGSSEPNPGVSFYVKGIVSEDISRDSKSLEEVAQEKFYTELRIRLLKADKHFSRKLLHGNASKYLGRISNPQEVFDEVFYELSVSKFPLSTEKREIERLLHTLTRSWSRKINSSLIVAMAICTDTMYELERSIVIFSSLKRVIDCDIKYMETKLNQVIMDLGGIQSKGSSLEIDAFKQQIRSQSLVLDRISCYIRSSEWSILPQAQSVLGMRSEASQLLKSMSPF
ncbi:hypothetical protein OY671_005100 [Metschnikowia pulcherrima]|nr:hypothetical protein OY671_005100 [Metschnikowia pulcherrima]